MEAALPWRSPTPGEARHAYHTMVVLVSTDDMPQVAAIPTKCKIIDLILDMYILYVFRKLYILYCILMYCIINVLYCILMY